MPGSEGTPELTSPMRPHRDGDEYIVRPYPDPERPGKARFSAPNGAAEYLRLLHGSWEIIHVRDGGATEVARYWPSTVTDSLRFWPGDRPPTPGEQATAGKFHRRYHGKYRAGPVSTCPMTSCLAITAALSGRS